MLNIKYMVSDHALLHSYPTSDSNTNTGMILVTLNMLSAVEECPQTVREFHIVEWSPWVLQLY